MAIQMEIYIKGRQGNTVFYKRQGKWISRSAPAKVKQTKAMKTRSTNFGIASAAGKHLRHLLEPVLPFPKDKKMQNSFSGTIALWLKLQAKNAIAPSQDIEALNGFNINEKTSVAERFRVACTVSGNRGQPLQLYIPAFVPARAISAPAHTSSVIIKVCAAACMPGSGEGQGKADFSFELPYNDSRVAEQFISLPVNTLAGSLVVTVMSGSYKLSTGKPVTNLAFMPCSAIIGRFY
jgi:hypothetical protein